MPDEGSGTGRFAHAWTRFRGWPVSLQAVAWVVLGVVVFSVLTTDEDNTDTAVQSESATSTTETTPTTERPVKTTTGAERRSPSECEKAFKDAADVHELRDSHEDLWPAFESCGSIEEFAAASEKHPGAVEQGVDPQTYVENQCLYEPALASALLCEAR